RRRRLPLDVDQPRDLALVEDRRTRAEMHGDPLAAGDEPDDRITGDRVAALREPDEQVADALDADTAGPRDLGRRRSDGRQPDLRVVEDAEPRDDLLGADRAVSDRRVEVLEGF